MRTFWVRYGFRRPGRKGGRLSEGRTLWRGRTEETARRSFMRANRGVTVLEFADPQLEMFHPVLHRVD